MIHTAKDNSVATTPATVIQYKNGFPVAPQSNRSAHYYASRSKAKRAFISAHGEANLSELRYVEGTGANAGKFAFARVVDRTTNDELNVAAKLSNGKHTPAVDGAADDDNEVVDVPAKAAKSGIAAMVTTLTKGSTRKAAAKPASKLTIQKGLPTKNGIKAYSEGSVGHTLFKLYDALHAKGTTVTLAMTQEIAAAHKLNPTSATLALYQWRKFNNIAKPSKAAAKAKAGTKAPVKAKVATKAVKSVKAKAKAKTK